MQEGDRMCNSIKVWVVFGLDKLPRSSQNFSKKGQRSMF